MSITAAPGLFVVAGALASRGGVGRATDSPTWADVAARPSEDRPFAVPCSFVRADAEPCASEAARIAPRSTPAPRTRVVPRSFDAPVGTAGGWAGPDALASSRADCSASDTCPDTRCATHCWFVHARPDAGAAGSSARAAFGWSGSVVVAVRSSASGSSGPRLSFCASVPGVLWASASDAKSVRESCGVAARARSRSRTNHASNPRGSCSPSAEFGDETRDSGASDGGLGLIETGFGIKGGSSEATHRRSCRASATVRASPLPTRDRPERSRQTLYCAAVPAWR